MAVLMSKSSVSAKSVVAKQSRSRTMSVIVRASQPTADIVVRPSSQSSDHNIYCRFQLEPESFTELA